MANTIYARNRPFDPIRPGDVDVFAYDFVDELGNLGTITSAVWECALSVRSTEQDPDAASRILTDASWDDTRTSVKAGEMLDGCIYVLTATVTTTDDRLLSYSADVLCMLEPERVTPTGTGMVIFDYDEWLYRFPVFQYVDPDRAQRYFDGACVLHPNDGSGPITDIPSQTTALYLLTAHLAQLAGASGASGAAGAPSWLSGRISSASQGPISISTEGFQFKGGLGGWYGSTPYGAMYWAMMAKYRTFRWRTGPPNRARVFPPGPYGYRFGRYSWWQ
jgi:hypothetical protein